jgi:hypothetical protein
MLDGGEDPVEGFVRGRRFPRQTQNSRRYSKLKLIEVPY